jgi:hypothetical protein
LGLTIDAGFHQPQNPCHAPTSGPRTGAKILVPAPPVSRRSRGTDPQLVVSTGFFERLPWVSEPAALPRALETRK